MQNSTYFMTHRTTYDQYTHRIRLRKVLRSLVFCLTTLKDPSQYGQVDQDFYYVTKLTDVRMKRSLFIFESTSQIP